MAVQTGDPKFELPTLQHKIKVLETAISELSSVKPESNTYVQTCNLFFPQNKEAILAHKQEELQSLKKRLQELSKTTLSQQRQV